MGTLGGQEMLVIVILALLLFGPKELPKIARTIGKAMTEFRRAQNDLKTTFNREMQNLERESGIKELTATNYMADYGSHDDSYYDGSADSYDVYSDDTTTTTYDTSASAIEGAEYQAGPLQIEAAADTVPNGHVLDAGHAEAVHAEAVDPSASAHHEADHAAAGSPVHG
jgi:Tat protein translocase TatB subunit